MKTIKLGKGKGIAAAAAYDITYDAARAAVYAKRQFIKDYIFLVLREMIGPIKQEIVLSENFYQRIGVKNV